MAKLMFDGRAVTIGDLFRERLRNALPTDPIPNAAQLAYELNEGDTFVWSTIGEEKGVFYVANPEAIPIRVNPDGTAETIRFDLAEPPLSRAARMLALLKRALALHEHLDQCVCCDWCNMPGTGEFDQVQREIAALIRELSEGEGGA